ncbi:MAG: tetratricopeptide repeat protein, partial [Aggregatilineales bacterium]
TESADLFATVVEERPTNIAYLYEYGQLLIDLDRPEEALELAEKIKSLNPGDVRGLTLQTRSMVWMGDSTAAIPIGLTGLQRDPSFGALYAALSRAYVNTQQWREGLDAGERAIDLAPDDMHTYWAYAYALRSVAAYEESIFALERTTELNPGFTPPYMELAFLYLSLDRDQEAIEIYNRVVGLEPRNARALMRLCDAYRKIGEFEQALGRCEDAVNADPTLSSAQFRLGTLLYNRREFTRAQQAFQACVDLDEGSLVCTYRLGLSHYYLVDETVLACNAQGIINDDCEHEVHCDATWTLLQDALLMAQTQGNADTDIQIIREGLTALGSNAFCPAYAGSAVPPPESTPEADPAADI